MRRIILLLIAFTILFITLKLPALDTPIAKGLGILAFVGFLWITEAFEIYTTALVVPILAVIFGIFDVKSAFSAFSHPIIFLFLAGFVFAGAMSKYHIDRYIAYRIVAISRGNLFLSAILIMVITAFLSMWMSNTSTTALMLPIVMGITRHLEHRERVFFLLLTAYSASLGGLGTPVGSPPNALAAAITGITFQQWFFKSIPFLVIALAVLIAILILVVKPDLSERGIRMDERIRFSPGRKGTVLIILFLMTAIGWIFSDYFSSLMGIEKGFDTFVAIFFVVLLLAGDIINWSDVQKYVNWGILLLFGGGLTLSAIMKETGTAHFISSWLLEVLKGFPSWAILLVIILMAIFLTELMSNTALSAILIPIKIPLADSLGFSQQMIAMVIAYAASCAFMLPVATPPNALVFGTGDIRQQEMMRVGFVLNIVFAFLILGYFLIFQV